MIIPVGYAQVTHLFEGDGVPRGAAVTYGIQLVGTDFGENRVEALHDAFADTVLLNLSATCPLRRTLLKYGPQATGPSFEFAETRFGDVLGTVMPPQVTYLVKKRTSSGGRTGQGRFYLPGVVESAADGTGAVDPQWISDIQAQLDIWAARLETEDMPAVLLSATASDPKPITKWQVDGFVATQRRRLR